MTTQLTIRQYAPLKPETFDDRTRSVRIVAATENPIIKRDPVLGVRINIVHFVDGFIIPPSGQVPLLDSHDRSSVSNVLGSVRNFEVKNRVLECDVFFSGTSAAKDAAQKVKEGHLTDFSVGYYYLLSDSHLIPPGKTKEIRGRTFKGPVRVITKCYLREVSIAPIGADRYAKVKISDKSKTKFQPDTSDIILFVFVVYLLFFLLIRI
ncbi:HK97 family phage prohead protease [Desulfococcaceae bacterium HSG8]|nr:HK97 family phage prohead protease [Desulfococcaceae bacterium HSG8]